MTIEELTPEQIAETLNRFKWRGREDWSITRRAEIGTPWIRYDDRDARAIASYLLLTQPGSFFWALERMKEGKRVTHAEFAPPNGLYIEESDNEIRWVDDGEWWQPYLEDFTDARWQLVETGEKE